MTEPITGLWWLPERPERRVSGTLDQALDGKFTLQTYSSLEGDTPIVGEQDIYGLVDAIPVTMGNARWWGSVGGTDSEFTREKYVGWSVVSGIHTTPDTVFSGVDMQSEFLDGWIDKHLWDQSVTLDGLKINGFPELESSEYPNGKLYLFYGTSRSTGNKHWSISRSTSLSVHPASESIRIADCERQVQHLDSLMDIIFARTTSATEVTLRQPSEGRLTPAGGLALRGSIARPKFSEPERRLHQLDGLCTFTEFGELGGIAKWFSLDSNFRYLAGRITSHYRSEGRYLDDRALTAFAAGEALDRAECGFSNSTARTRWKRLAQQIPTFVEEFIGVTVDDWTNGLVETRDDLAHVLTFEMTDEMVARMVGFSQSAHFLSVLSLLRIAGLGGAITRMPAGYRWREMRGEYEHCMRVAGMI